jgi:hypothetical protein
MARGCYCPAGRKAAEMPGDPETGDGGGDPGMRVLAIAWTAGATVLAAGPAGAVDLVPHRAVYDLALAADREALGESATGMSGRMVFEFTGAACEGWTVNFRFVMEVAGEGGGSSVTDLRSSSFEDAAGTAFQFLSQTYTNQVLTESVKGTAKRDAAGTVAVELVTPKAAALSFPDRPVFPTDHLRRIIEAAERGETILAQSVFDGSETGDKVYRTTTVIGPARTAPATGEDAQVGDLRRWPVSVAYFDATKAGDQTPDYAISFDLWENGVSTDLTMDYGDFALTGTLADYEVLPASGCPE